MTSSDDTARDDATAETTPFDDTQAEIPTQVFEAASNVDENGLVRPVEGRELSPLEQAIRDGQAGTGEMNEVIGQLVNALVVVPTATEVNQDLNEMQPVLFDRNGTPMLAAFTNVDRIANAVVEVAQYAVQLPAAELIQAIPAETGLVINPGNTEGFEILPEGVVQLINDVRGMLAALEEQQQAEQPTTPSKVSPSQIPNF
ncbi:SseB family protein [Frondihabitans cladoniiphilus]|uniref:SseB protein N-terminal domain-containing protein n=1 Tax=Frondihabitans cladoniiphilus TaxID=715785 RepID=A0ABP8VV14_9MICO